MERLWAAKSLVNQLIEQNDKAFQIAVEDSNVAAKRLYEKDRFCQTDTGSLFEWRVKNAIEEFENVPAVIRPTDRSIRGGGEICDTSFYLLMEKSLNE